MHPQLKEAAMGTECCIWRAGATHIEGQHQRGVDIGCQNGASRVAECNYLPWTKTAVCLSIRQQEGHCLRSLVNKRTCAQSHGWPFRENLSTQNYIIAVSAKAQRSNRAACQPSIKLMARLQAQQFLNRSSLWTPSFVGKEVLHLLHLNSRKLGYGFREMNCGQPDELTSNALSSWYWLLEAAAGA